MGSLFFLLLPGVGFTAGLMVLSGKPGFRWLQNPMQYPWELWVLVLGGLAAALGGFLDWKFHRLQGVLVGPREKQYELIALGAGGTPLFVLMSMASLSSRPHDYLLPVLGVLIFTVVMICYDEFIFHRKRCGRYETFLHRLLVFGNGFAWLAWAHWCFVKGGAYALVP